MSIKLKLSFACKTLGMSGVLDASLSNKQVSSYAAWCMFRDGKDIARKALLEHLVLKYKMRYILEIITNAVVKIKKGK